MNYAIILAGGFGRRFWPLSKVFQPKQFLSIGTNSSMLEETLSRIKNFIPCANIFIATNKLYRLKIKEISRRFNIANSNLLFEPRARNTLSSVGYLTYQIQKKDKEAVVFVFPSDHYIKGKRKFINLLKKAAYLAKTKGLIVTFGIKPKRPETGYGYLKIAISGRINSKVYKVEKFIEKPPLNRTKRFIKDKRYYWNSGIFVFRAKTILEEIKKYTPFTYRIIQRIKNKKDIKRIWHNFPDISLDKAVMMKTDKIAMFASTFGWVDLGSWCAVEEIMKKDKNQNISKGRHIDLGSKNILVWSTQKPILTLGLRNLVIIDTKEGLLVCAKDKAQEVKNIVKKISYH
ncbi:MAG: sugar phosphate nucleotidyltransferase [Candidatus Omnitrophica bacterium]|nr:sugar phosphate nucleotidyltransferase [Candidatus Omnitrophota bacterium]